MKKNFFIYLVILLPIFYEGNNGNLPLGSPLGDRGIEIVSPFGWRTIRGKKEFHEGIDIKAEIGTPVYATANGKVIFAGRQRGRGKNVIVCHGNGFVTRYSHLSKIKVKRGKQIKKGDIIGYSGNTGRSTGPHLCYTILENGHPVDPTEYINAVHFSKNLSLEKEVKTPKKIEKEEYKISCIGPEYLDLNTK